MATWKAGALRPRAGFVGVFLGDLGLRLGLYHDPSSSRHKERARQHRAR
jgi:hypothetical protein